MLYDDLTRVQLKKAYTMIAAKPSLEYRTDDETMLILSRAKHSLEYRTDDETTFIQVWNHAVESLAYFTCHKTCCAICTTSFLHKMKILS